MTRAAIDFNSPEYLDAVKVMALHRALDAVPPPQEKRREYVGASAIGGPCERSVQYEFLGVPRDEGWRHDAKTLRIFQRGHMMESAAAQWLCDAGFRLIQSKRDGGPIGFSVADGQFKGHVDRVIISGPINLQYPLIWEHKALGSKSWTAIRNRGLAAAKPEYAAQVYLYQAYCELTAPALFQATNTDTMEIHFELVEFDKAKAQAASDRAAAVIADSKAGAMRPRPTDDPEFYVCKNCAFRQRCWQ